MATNSEERKVMAAVSKKVPKKYQDKTSIEKLRHLELELRAMIDSGELSPGVAYQVSIQLSRLALDIEKLSPVEVVENDPIEKIRLKAIR